MHAEEAVIGWTLAAFASTITALSFCRAIRIAERLEEKKKKGKVLDCNLLCAAYNIILLTFYHLSNTRD